uniref:Interleukin 20 receptor subunit beta n=1 Tax=Catharus ustulatus TaxID=91951 RepID=A0A8C3V243_CATUS
PAPQSISILSTNMKHFLTWSPVIIQGATVRYSVEFQGEYEREYANGSWIPISECSLTTATLCNVTQDISASVPYRLRVRAELGSARSPWGTTEGFFTPSLTPPQLRVLADGHHLLVELADMGPSFQFHVLYWKKGQESRKVTREVSSVVHLDTMEAGAEYCVKAQAHVEAINRSSSFSPTQCVRAQGESDTSLWLVTALISSAGFALAALTLLFLTWKISRIFQYFFCPTAVLPDTLVTFFTVFYWYLYAGFSQEDGAGRKSRFPGSLAHPRVGAELRDQQPRMAAQLSLPLAQALGREAAPGASGEKAWEAGLTQPEQLLHVPCSPLSSSVLAKEKCIQSSSGMC